MEHELGSARLGVVARRDPTRIAHPHEHHVAARRGRGGVVDGVVVGRRPQDAHERRGLRDRELRGRHSEVVQRGSTDSVGAVAEVHGVEIALEDLVLRELFLEDHGVPQLTQLAREGRLRDVLLLRGGVRLGQEEVLDVLLGDA